MHHVFHVLVLVTTLLGAAGAALLVVAPLAFDEAPESLRRVRPLLIGLIAAAAGLLLVEWLLVH